MPVQKIQGIECHYREKEFGEEILYENLPEEEQYFRRTVHPFSDDELIAIANKELQYSGYSTIQKQFVDREKERFKKGVYAYIRGALVFIPGAYWCYVNYWTLEHGEKPDYREDDRIFFIFHEYLRLETNCLGITRGKGRRQGATSIGTFFMWFVAGREEYKNCGMTSYNDTVAQDVFQKMFIYGFKAMLPCFQEDFDSDSENFVRFIKTTDRKKKGVLAVKREGLNSYVNYLPNTINSYDSGRQSYNVPDESGKRHKVNINSYWSKLYKTFLVGKNKVGFGYLPTTVNKAKEGGENFKIFWKNANQEGINSKTGEPRGINTPNRCVRYFVPATHCYAGCIDRYGHSIIEDPLEPVMGNDGKLIIEGSRTIIKRERDSIQEREQIMEHRRDYPLDEYDMFAFETGLCEFNEDRIVEQLNELERNPPSIRQARIIAKDRTIKSIFPTKPDRVIKEVGIMDDEKGAWYFLELPNEANKFKTLGDYLEPDNTGLYVIGVDTVKDLDAKNGSKAVAVVMKKSCIINGEETGLMPVAMRISDSRLGVHFDEEIALACRYYGCKVCFEIDARDDYYRYFRSINMQSFLEWTPTALRSPTNKNQKIEPGVRSGNPFQLYQQLQIAKMYFDGDSVDHYNGNTHRIKFVSLLQQALHYDHAERTPYDEMIALMMALVTMIGAQQAPKLIDNRISQILPTYKIKMMA